MRQFDLQEYESSDPVQLTVAERDELVGVLPSLTIVPAQGMEGGYILHPGSTVGAVEIGGLSVLIQPKMDIPHLLWMASYAMGVFRQQEDRFFDFAENELVPDTLALALAAAARRAFAQGLLHGYLTEEDALSTVRGRIRFDEQILRRFGAPLPAEVQYDEFTDDILANRLVKAAAHLVGRMRLRSEKARRDLGWVAGILDNVSLIEFPPADVHQVIFDRLNGHYRSVVELSRLILRHSAFESSRGRVRASGILMDMNQVFQEFVTVALREALGLSNQTRQTFGERVIDSLDEGGLVNLRPDLVWWNGRYCLFVGDAKYRRVTSTDFPNANIYQMLAYCTAAKSSWGLLVYAKGDSESGCHRIRHADKTIEVASIDLSGKPAEILDEVRRIAKRIKVHVRQESSTPA